MFAGSGFGSDASSRLPVLSRKTDPLPDAWLGPLDASFKPVAAAISCGSAFEGS